MQSSTVHPNTSYTQILTCPQLVTTGCVVDCVIMQTPDSKHRLYALAGGIQGEPGSKLSEPGSKDLISYVSIEF